MPSNIIMLYIWERGRMMCSITGPILYCLLSAIYTIVIHCNALRLPRSTDSQCLHEHRLFVELKLVLVTRALDLA